MRVALCCFSCLQWMASPLSLSPFSIPSHPPFLHTHVHTLGNYSSFQASLSSGPFLFAPPYPPLSSSQPWDWHYPQRAIRLYMFQQPPISLSHREMFRMTGWERGGGDCVHLWLCMRTRPSREATGGKRNELERQKKYLWEMRQGKRLVCVCVCVRVI